MSLLQRLLKNALLTPELTQLIAQAPQSAGSLGYDRWGLHAPTQQLGLGFAKILYDRFFRTQAYGLEHVPAHGRVLIIANHSGYVPTDGILIGVALATNPHGSRFPRAMAERFLPTIPFIGNLITAVGAVVGEPKNCEDMLNHEEAVMVFPEGVRGTGKGYQKRYQLQRFGHGFMHLAMETNTPIIPVGVVGCEEAFPMYGNLPGLARRLGIPYVPITPLVPLPYPVTLHFGEPLYFHGPVLNEAQVSDHVGQVKAAIDALLASGLAMREAKRSGSATAAEREEREQEGRKPRSRKAVSKKSGGTKS